MKALWSNPRPIIQKERVTENIHMEYTIKYLRENRIKRIYAIKLNDGKRICTKVRAHDKRRKNDFIHITTFIISFFIIEHKMEIL